MPESAHPHPSPADLDAHTPEHTRLADQREGRVDWRKWGPYLSERQWGTVREDYSPDGAAWGYFPHDHARSRAYRWGEDGIAGFSDNHQRLCFAIALWNGRDPILKERLFGLTNGEGNHGEDVKELYYCLDATPTHSYLKTLYKYSQAAFPYNALVAENRRRGASQPEYELIDTRIFDDDRYFDVFVEYAKAAPEDVFACITVHNRGPDAADLALLPQVWFRNIWTWSATALKPSLEVADDGGIAAQHSELGDYRIYADGAPKLLVCENETNVRRLFGVENATGHFKDAFNDYIVHCQYDAVNPALRGTKAGFLYQLHIPSGGSARVRVRICPTAQRNPFSDADATVQRRREEADAFYAVIQHAQTNSDARLVQRQALAGMIWNQQYYHYDIPIWLKGDPTQPAPPPQRIHGRNSDWKHVNNADIISMPDKWEYPWYAAWDLAFHCIPLAMIDPDFAKDQLVLLTREWYMHPNGQLPAYEWAFGDVNPPVHAWAAWRVFQMEQKHHGRTDFAFLERVFHKLLLNFTWWVNRKDALGLNLFQGGFLGMDNIGVFDRNTKLPPGVYLNQADGTAWMAMYCLNMLRISLALACHNRVYEDIATKFFEHFLDIAHAMTDVAGKGYGLWDDQDGFYYDVLNLPNGQMIPMRLRSAVGLIPLFAVETIEPETLKALPNFAARLEWYLNYRPEIAALVSRWNEPGRGERRLLSLMRGHRMKLVLRHMLDETHFLSDYGVRSLSKCYEKQPYVFQLGPHNLSVHYQPGDSDTTVFGGNSNWRGPIWFPVNYLVIESLQKFHHYYGDDFKIECPAGSGKFVTILEVAEELTRRLARIFLRDEHGRRPLFGQCEKYQNDPNFRDYLFFNEYFHGDNGRGLGASRQTGWTGLIAKLLQPRGGARASTPAEERAKAISGQPSVPLRS